MYSTLLHRTKHLIMTIFCIFHELSDLSCAMITAAYNPSSLTFFLYGIIRFASQQCLVLYSPGTSRPYNSQKMAGSFNNPEITHSLKRFLIWLEKSRWFRVPDLQGAFPKPFGAEGPPRIFPRAPTTFVKTPVGTLYIPEAPEYKRG